MYNPWVFANTDERKKFKIGGYVEFYKYNEDKELRTCQKSIPDIDLMTISLFSTL